MNSAAGRLVEAAPAKINLTLGVVGRRADGFHLLDSIVAFADVGERLTLEPAETTGLTIGFAPGHPAGGDGLGAGADNLVLRADAAFRARHPATPPVRYRLDKAIPLAAGLGGGSADAAAALRGLARLAGAPAGALGALAAGLGADVPVCLGARAARMTGIGEVVRPLRRAPPFAVLLVHAGGPLATAEVFAALGPSRGEPRAADDLAETDLARAVIDGGNDLEAAARRLRPEIGEAIDRIGRTEGCLAARMTGSGAACFGLYARPGEARRAAAAIAADRPGWWVRAAALR